MSAKGVSGLLVFSALAVAMLTGCSGPAAEQAAPAAAPPSSPAAEPTPPAPAPAAPTNPAPAATPAAAPAPTSPAAPAPTRAPASASVAAPAPTPAAVSPPRPAPAAPQPAPASSAGSASGAGGFDTAHAKATFQELCSTCHDVSLATDQRHNRAGWQAVIDRMYGFGLAATDAQAREIVDYLTRTYPQ